MDADTPVKLVRGPDGQEGPFLAVRPRAGRTAARLADRPNEVDYEGVLERIPAVTYVAGFGESGAWTYVSGQIEAMLGFSPLEWQADPYLWFRQIHPEDRARAVEEENASKATGQPLHSEYRMLTRDGRTLWVSDEGVLVHDPEGHPAYWQGFMIDVTARKEAEQALHDSEVRYRGLFDHVPIGIYRSTLDGRFLDANRALARILGYPSRDALLAVDVLDLYVDPADRERLLSQIEAEGSVSDFELQVRRPDGSVIWVRDSSRAIRDHDEQVLWVEGVIEDITRRKQAEWEARQATQQLMESVSRLEVRNREMTLINEMGDFLQSCPTAEEAFAVIGHWAEQLFPGIAGAVCMINDSRNVVEPVATWGGPHTVEGIFPPEDCWALRAGRVHAMNDAESRLRCRHLAAAPPSGMLCVPMSAQGEALGILHLQAGSREGSARTAEATVESVRQLAVAVAEHLALALANLRLRETLRTQSIRDPLTGLFNRRYMEESLERELRRAERRHHPVGVVMMDFDHFSRFNNAYGHQAGDSLLRAFGEMVRTHIRSEDIACRYGGEEFTLILPEAPAEVAVGRADQLRVRLKELHLSLRGASLGVVTVSVGVAMFPEHGTSADGLLAVADAALYRAKAEGRDRVVVGYPQA